MRIYRLLTLLKMAVIVHDSNVPELDRCGIFLYDMIGVDKDLDDYFTNLQNVL